MHDHSTEGSDRPLDERPAEERSGTPLRGPAIVPGAGLLNVTRETSDEDHGAGADMGPYGPDGAGAAENRDD
ncbi:hypothetical protein LJR225_001140 [Phenylobacterium sp. LjRoot225]|uniref:hypothetical protein n=1 Tax=Phenylobacterium sp. LjRoot225 TaxID=3342285 RepID=UPI003ECE6587